jgi:pimeloyl-ACP methyl ester carboxylesterase
MTPPPDDNAVLIEGPWTHRHVNANGSRFHVVEAGSGPLILLLHGFPEFWWTWRHQIPDLAAAGYRVAAVDLRGYGSSDKPPRGYDAYTLANDVAGLIRALGERDAMIAGHDWGAFLAWTAAAFHPRMIRRIAVLGMAHPLRLRTALATDPRGQLAASRYLFAFQAPRFEHVLRRRDAKLVGDLLARWSGPAWRDTEDFAEYQRVCRSVMLMPQAAFCALEYYRWSVRSLTRPSGWRFAALLERPVDAPALQIHGELDPACLPATAQGSGRYVAGSYEWQLLPNVGHFPHAEAPEHVTAELIRWAKEDSP